MSFDRIIVIAPTRSTCVNLHHLIGLPSLPETLLMQECANELDTAINGLPLGGFGVVAGTGTGKSAAIRRMCLAVLSTSLSIGIVTLEHQSDKLVKGRNVLVITPGIAVQWAKNGQIGVRDLIVIDEIHQTSDHLELAMALLKRIGCTFVWMSATIDPAAYQHYFGAQSVIRCTAYDLDKRANVHYHIGPMNDVQAAVSAFLRQELDRIVTRGRGVVVFVPARADAETLSAGLQDIDGLHADFYHGGEPAEKLRQYMSGEVQRPFVIFMTAAGSSSLNLTGLDTVVIADRQFREEIRAGRRRLVSDNLSSNMLLQMAGRVDGRADNGEVHILTDNLDLDLRATVPTVPDFVLGGDLELLALTTARLGVPLEELSLIGSIDDLAYAKVFSRFCERRLISLSGCVPRLTSLGQQIERLPVGAAWGEVIVNAQRIGNPDLLRVVCLTACTGDLYGLTGPRLARFSDRNVVSGSEHLTAYNIVATALRAHASLEKEHRYKLDNKQFMEWCKKRGYSHKEIRGIILLFVSLLQRLDIGLPQPQDFTTVTNSGTMHDTFVELLAITQSMQYVQDNRHGLTSVFGNDRHGVSHGTSVLGAIRYFTDKLGIPRAVVEGTEIPTEVVNRYASREYNGVWANLNGTVSVGCELFFAGQRFPGPSVRMLPDEVPAELQSQLDVAMTLHTQRYADTYASAANRWY